MSSETALCSVCGSAIPYGAAIPSRVMRASLRTALERRRGGALGDADQVCLPCVRRARFEQLLARLAAERGELTTIEREVVAKATTHETLAKNLEDEFRGGATRGQRLADAVARVGGSWLFVVSFVAGLVVWMLVNTVGLASHPFDPYPFILLNLVLSCLAALQAPIIMMSQNRASARDRMQADHDFRVNLKAELEIEGLHEKMDHVLHGQWESLLALHQAQLDLLVDIGEQLGARRSSAPPPSIAR